MMTARFINWPDTLEDVGYPKRFSKQCDIFKQTLNQRKEAKKKVWNSAYTISTNGVKMAKPEYICDIVLLPAWSKNFKFKSCQELFDQLMTLNGVKEFMAGQIVADVKYAQLKDSEDFHSFAVSGPGSKRGLSRVTERDLKYIWKEEEWLEAFRPIHQEINSRLDMDPITGQDFQNCLCEFDKYERTLWEEGRPSKKYKGTA